MGSVEAQVPSAGTLVLRARTLEQQGTIFALARVKQDLLARLDAFGLTGKIGTERLFPTLPTAVQAYERWARQHPPGPQPSPPTG